MTLLQMEKKHMFLDKQTKWYDVFIKTIREVLTESTYQLNLIFILTYTNSKMFMTQQDTSFKQI